MKHLDSNHSSLFCLLVFLCESVCVSTLWWASDQYFIMKWLTHLSTRDLTVQLWETPEREFREAK